MNAKTFLDLSRKKLGLVPHKRLNGAYNPAAIHAAYARQANAVLPGFSDADGSVHMKDSFGYVGGYAVPLPDELKMKAGTIYPNGMQLITQPLWHSQTFTLSSTTSLNFFNVTSTGITGNMDAAGQLAFPMSFIIRAIRFVPQLSNSFQTTAAVANNPNDIGLLIYNSYHTLVVSSKQYLRIPSFMLPGGAGIGGAAVGSSATAANTSIAVGNHGIADPRAIYVLLDPLWLESQVNFQYTVTWSATQATSVSPTLFVVLDGQQIRPVQ